MSEIERTEQEVAGGSSVETATVTESEPVLLTMNDSDVVRYYSATSAPDLRDIVVYARQRYPHPWQKVILETNMSLPVRDLENLMIFIKGVNDEKVHQIRGLGAFCCCPIYVSQETVGTGDYGIRAMLAKYTMEYNVTSIEILIYGEERDALQGAWEYIQNQGDISASVYFPVEFATSIKLFENGLDVAPYAKKLYNAYFRSAITSQYLREIMEELRAQVRSGKTAIQDLEETRSIYAKWLSMCLIQEFSLPPVYLSSYISEYVALHVGYSFEKLSLFERVNFLRSLPRHVGYIGRNQEFRCLYSIEKKIFPNAALAFNLDTGTIVSEGLEDMFQLETMEISDYRHMFPGSKDYFIKQQAGLASSATPDRDVDKRLVEMFTNMTAAIGASDVFMSIRNTVLTRLNGQTYIVYYTEPFGVWGILQSEQFGSHPFAVTEENFHRLIDVKVILADHARRVAPTQSAGDSQYKEIMLQAASTFKPAIPTFLLMCSELGRYLSNDMSYFDKRLRCDKNVFPIVTHMDSVLSERNSLFDYVDLLNVRQDRVSRDVISAFGTLNFDAGSEFLTRIPVSIDTFKGCNLL